MLQLILHGIGDYILQNDWMATNKTKVMKPKGVVACAIHCTLYTIPFYLLTHSFYALFFIWMTHFAIDHFRLAVYWIKLVNWNWLSTNYGYDNRKPVFLSTWLLIIVDNIFHLICNYFAISHL